MKKVIIFCIVFANVLIGTMIKVKATDSTVYVGVVGDVKAGSEINIVIDLENIHNLYAASVKYQYDNQLLSVEAIEINPNIKTDNTYEATSEVAANGNTVKYEYTNLGETNGYSGNTNFMVIKAKVLKDGNIDINADNLEICLIGRGSDIEDINYILKAPEKSWDIVKNNDGNLKSTEISQSSEGHDFIKSLSDISKHDSNDLKEKDEDKKLDKDLDKEESIDNESKSVQEEANINDEKGSTESTEEKSESDNGDSEKSKSGIIPIVIVGIITVVCIIEFRRIK